MEASARFSDEPRSVRAARRFVVDRLEDGGRGELADPLALVVSELATNAIVHARSPFVVDIRVDAAVEVGVSDEGPGRPTRVQERADATGGRGLAILDGVCSDWGVQERQPGKRVWCSVHADGGTAAGDPATASQEPGRD